MSLVNFDIRQADANYKSFPTFAEWLKRTKIETVRWDRYTNRLNQLKQTANGDIVRVREAIEVATAIDTGALEGLYETDRGFTFTVAFESAVWQTVVEDKKGDKVRALIQAQLNAFEYVFDFATGSVPVTATWIRELHNQICREQETYKAFTELGWQDLQLPKGQYKTLPNHIVNKDDSIHSHAPVDLTPMEMIRLCDEINNDDFQNAHAVIQASYIHYAFVLIHPFADGNGRVSRALASIFTYRSHSIPLLIFSDSRNDYISSLEAADKGNFQAFVDFVLNAALSSIKLFSESLESSSKSEIETSLEQIKNLYTTKGGYSQQEVDEAAFRLLEEFEKELRHQVAKYNFDESVEVQFNRSRSSENPKLPDYRQPMKNDDTMLYFSLRASEPFSVWFQNCYYLEVPKDCGQNDDIILREKFSGSIFEVQANELIPNSTTALQMRIKLFVSKSIKNALDKLFENAKQV
jgi:Fic family protein